MYNKLMIVDKGLFLRLIGLFILLFAIIWPVNSIAQSPRQVFSLDSLQFDWHQDKDYLLEKISGRNGLRDTVDLGQSRFDNFRGISYRYFRAKDNSRFKVTDSIFSIRNSWLINSDGLISFHEDTPSDYKLVVGGLITESNLKITHRAGRIRLNSSFIGKELSFKTLNANTIYIRDSYISKLEIDQNTIKELHIVNSVIDTLVMSSVEIETITMDLKYLPRYMELSKPRDLKSFSFIGVLRRPSMIESGEKCFLKIDNLNDLSAFEINYADFKLYDEEEDSLKPTAYRKVLNAFNFLENRFKTFGEEKNYELLDKDRRAFKERYDPDLNDWTKGLRRVSNTISYIWWDYGYNKGLIPLHTVILFLLFSLINLNFLEKLVKDVYCLENIQEGYSHNKKKFIYSLLFTGIVFFGLQMSMEKLKFQSMRLALWIIFQYTVGLVCLGYLVNLVVTEVEVGI